MPKWFARNLQGIHVPLILLAVFLHERNYPAGLLVRAEDPTRKAAEDRFRPPGRTVPAPL